MPGTLSQWQIWFFRHAGFLALPNVFDSEEVDAIRGLVEAQAERRDEAIEVDKDGRLAKVGGLIQRDARFSRLFASEALLGPLESLLGPNVELLLSRHNHATLRDGALRSRRLHRDVLQWSRTVVSAVVQLDDSVGEQAATRVVPGSHLLPFVGRPNNGGTWMDEHGVFRSLLDQAVPVSVGKGGVLLVDGVCFHSAGWRGDEGDRMRITLAYRAVDELEKDPSGGLLVSGAHEYRGHSYAPAADWQSGR